MKQLLIRCLALSPIMAAVLSGTSCICDRPVEDKFYLTTWTSSEEPFDDLTIEFLYGGNISAQASGTIGSFGTYEQQGDAAIFKGLYLILDHSVIIIEDAQLFNKVLFINWHFSTSSTIFTTRMKRLPEYPHDDTNPA